MRHKLNIWYLRISAYLLHEQMGLKKRVHIASMPTTLLAPPDAHSRVMLGSCRWAVRGGQLIARSWRHAVGGRR